VSELIKLAAALVDVFRLADRPRVDWRRGGVAVALLLTAIPIGVAAAGCAGAGLWIYLRPLIGAVGAALATGAALLLVSLVLAIVASGLLRRRSRAVPPVAEAVPRLGQAEPGQADRGSLLFAAFAAGLSAGAARPR
jgi:hypothetical protein